MSGISRNIAEYNVTGSVGGNSTNIINGSGTLSSNNDAFNRTRVSEQYSLFENKNIHSLASSDFVSNLIGGSSTVVFDSTTGKVNLTIGTANGDKATHQTRRYFPYIPGKSQLVRLTGEFSIDKVNVQSNIGLFDDNNGLIFRKEGNTISVVVRSNTSGSPVETVIPQSQWNIDKLDGNGQSQITIDFNRALHFVIDYQWLGVGRVRFGIEYNGATIYCHQYSNSNLSNVAYLRTPSLPIRYEIKNLAVVGASSTMSAMCCSVVSEGGDLLHSYQYSDGNVLLRTGLASGTPLLALRLLNTYSGIANRRTIRLTEIEALTQGADAFLDVLHLTDATITGGAWVAVGTSSAAEINRTATSISGGTITKIGNIFIPQPTAVARYTFGIEQTQMLNRMIYLSQNYDSTASQAFVLRINSFSGVAIDAAGSFTWQEFA